jgi:hypothetical protein
MTRPETSALGEPRVEEAAGVDKRAPVVGVREIEIAAAREVVWTVLVELERWPSWNPDVRSMSVRGPLAVGSEFVWKAGPGKIVSTIRRLEPPPMIAWTGRTLGIRAIHFWWLEARGNATVVRTEESYDGVVARVFRRALQTALDTGLANGLRYLKAEAERAADASTTQGGGSRVENA